MRSLQKNSSAGCRKPQNRCAQDDCPLADLPQRSAGRWGQGLTKEKMKDCVWLTPDIVAQIEFREWTTANHLRHPKFIALREDKDPRDVVKE
jgi:ATP-dependent DNA ligase